MANPNLLPLLFTYLIVSSLSFIATVKADAAKDAHEFSYDEGSPDGPNKWGSLSADYKTCSDGESQSPINIEAKNAKDQPNDLKKDYKEAPAKLFNKGHALVVEWEGDAGGIEVNGSTYKLVQCHWHTPSEHTIDGKKYDAELHFVHKNDKKQLAVVGVLFSVGEADPFIQKMSESKFKSIGSNGNDLGKLSANSTTSSQKYFRYGGSLTTPPCSEGVTWTVAQTVKSISHEQIQSLKEPLDQHFHENARPVQELHSRTVTQFDDSTSRGTGTGTGTGTGAGASPGSDSNLTPSTPTPGAGTDSDLTPSTPSLAPGPSSSSSMLELRKGMMMLIQIYILFSLLF